MKKKKFRNTRAAIALQEMDLLSLENNDSDLTKRCKFNFSYLDTSQKVGQNFIDLKEVQLQKLFDSLKNFSLSSLDYLENHGPLVIYGSFPPSIKTEFKHPRSVPFEVLWGRFRLGSTLRLVGFRIPKEFDGRLHTATKLQYDTNTFYVVFIDQNHLFWKSEKP